MLDSSMSRCFLDLMEGKGNSDGFLSCSLAIRTNRPLSIHKNMKSKCGKMNNDKLMRY